VAPRGGGGMLQWEYKKGGGCRVIDGKMALGASGTSLSDGGGGTHT